jgi:hypothetical protein
VAQFVTDRLAMPPACEQLIVEALVLGWMIRKRIARGQKFMAYAETHMLHTAARPLIRAALSPRTAFYRWYHLDTDMPPPWASPDDGIIFPSKNTRGVSAGISRRRAG